MLDEAQRPPSYSIVGLSDVEAQELSTELRTFSALSKQLDEDHDRVLEKHGDCWAAYFGNGLQLIAPDLPALMLLANSFGLSLKSAAVAYVQADPHSLIV